jgi:hypothetical protein
MSIMRAPNVRACHRLPGQILRTRGWGWNYHGNFYAGRGSRLVSARLFGVCGRGRFVSDLVGIIEVFLPIDLKCHVDEKGTKD